MQHEPAATAAAQTPASTLAQDALVAQQVAEALSKVETVTTQRTQTITLAANVSATE